MFRDCLDCKKRHPGCQNIDTCKSYAESKKKLEEINKARRDSLSPKIVSGNIRDAISRLAKLSRAERRKKNRDEE